MTPPVGVDLDSTEAYRFDLPEELIAAHPLAERDSSRILVVPRAGGPQPALRDCVFRDLPDLLQPGDLLVRNETRVIPARLLGRLRPGGGKVEMLLLEPAAAPTANPLPADRVCWNALCRPARKLSPGTIVDLPGGEWARVTGLGDAGIRTLEFPARVDELLDQHGHIPLPPYILQRRSVEEGPERATDQPEDRERYQTVYARERGSVAAPTAGLHFTAQVLEELKHRGIQSAGLILHVGIGTFRPMESGRVSAHVMHRERGHLPPETVEAIARTKANGGRVIAVGTTSCRTLEGIAAQHGGALMPGDFETDLFIKPGHRFHILDGMITNFHLPESTLMVLVSALAGYEEIMAAYRHAVTARYRFFSYGDAMLIL